MKKIKLSLTQSDRNRPFNEKVAVATYWMKTNCSLPEYDEDTEEMIRELKNQCNRALSSIQRDMKKVKS